MDVNKNKVGFVTPNLAITGTSESLKQSILKIKKKHFVTKILYNISFKSN